jgi:DNA polymerase IV (DinB-like DNA polymerase)
MRIIGHLDMDAFFASIEERDNPRFQGLPIVVGADPRGGLGRGVVSTANYAARAYGIRSALPITRAWRLSEAARQQGKPAAIFLSGSWRRYSEVSAAVMALIKEHAPQMQQRSVDEAYFDLSPTGSFPNATALCRLLKARIQQELHLTASVGIAPNKLIAKIASDHDKPDGLTVVAPADVADFLGPLPLRAIPGVGPVTEQFLQKRGLRTINDALALSQEALEELLGKWGAALYSKIRGIDTSPLREVATAKSISEQTTFFADTLAASVLIPQALELCSHVHERLHEEGFTVFRTVTLMVRFADFTTLTYAEKS